GVRASLQARGQERKAAKPTKFFAPGKRPRRISRVASLPRAASAFHARGPLEAAPASRKHEDPAAGRGRRREKPKGGRRAGRFAHKMDSRRHKKAIRRWRVSL